MPVTDLTNTTWILNNNQNLSTNTAFDINFKSESNDRGLLQLSSQNILFDNSLAYGEEDTYITVDSTVELSTNVTNNYRVVTGGRLDARFNTINGNVILDGGDLVNSTITGQVAILSGTWFESCTVQGSAYIQSSIDLSNSTFQNRLNIIDASNLSLSNCTIQPTYTKGSGLNIINSSVEFENVIINIPSTSASEYNKIIIKGNSQVTFDNCQIDCNINLSTQNMIIEDTSSVTFVGDSFSYGSQVPPLNLSSNNIIITAGTFMWNPLNYSYITIPTGYEIRTRTVSGITLYQVIKSTN